LTALFLGRLFSAQGSKAPEITLLINQIDLFQRQESHGIGHRIVGHQAKPRGTGIGQGG
jgi:hypothetical protein